MDSSAKPGGSGQGKGIGEEAGPNSAIDVYPRFPGGDEARLYYLRLHVRYPEAAMKSLVQGVVMVVFIVEADGTVSSVEVPKKIGGGCDEEAIRVTKEMPRWEPGKRKGRAKHDRHYQNRNAFHVRIPPFLSIFNTQTNARD